jgi:hypothetical protein
MYLWKDRKELGGLKEKERLPVQKVSGSLSLGIKRLVRKADHSTSSSAEVKNAWSHSPICLHSVVLSEAQHTSSRCGTLLSTGCIHYVVLN